MVAKFLSNRKSCMKKVVLTSFVLILCLKLAGCGSGGGTAAIPPKSETPLPTVAGSEGGGKKAGQNNSVQQAPAP